MAQVLSQFNNQVQNIPFYNQVTGLYENQMGERFSTKDPFYEKIPAKDKRELKPGEKMEYKQIRRKPPTNISEKQRKLWKKIMKRAWYHDRNFCGCMPIDLGCGMISIVSIFPLIGSAIAYKMHYKMIKMCNEAGCPKKIQAEMVANIGLDFAMTLVPLLGVVLSWMKASSTRNAALFDTWIRQESNEKDALVQRQNHQQSRLQRPSPGPGGAPAPPAPSAAQAPATQSQQQTHARAPRSTGPRDAGGSSRANSPGQSRPQGSASGQTRAPPAQQRAAPQRRPVPNSAAGRTAQSQPPSTQNPSSRVSPGPQPVPAPSSPPPPPYQHPPAPNQPAARAPPPPAQSAPTAAPPQPPAHTTRAPQARPPVPPKIPASSPGPRRIPPAGSYDFSNRSHNEASHSSAYDQTSPYGSPYGSPSRTPSDSPYASPYGSPYGPSSYDNAYRASYGMPSASTAASPPFGQPTYGGAPPRAAYKSQRYFMQPAVHAQPEVVER